MGFMISEKQSFGRKSEVRMGNGLCAAIPCPRSVLSRWVRDASGKGEKASALGDVLAHVHWRFRIDKGPPTSGPLLTRNNIDFGPNYM